MRVAHSVLAVLVVAGCAKGKNRLHEDAPTDLDANCGPYSTTCDSDMDGVVNAYDLCPNTPPHTPVNSVGCADSQLTPMLDNVFPPYHLSWTSTGDLGRAGGLTWTYTGIMRGDLFHIWWIVCDDPTTPCGMSLDGPIDAAEGWTYDPTVTDLAAGTLVASNTTTILLASGSSVPLTGRLTMTIVDGSNAPIPVATVGTLQVPARLGQYGAEIKGTAYTVKAIAEVEDATSMTWTPYLDYYDAAQTPMGGSGANISFGGSFYDK